MDLVCDLNNQDIRITDKNGKVLFTMVGGSLEHASYVVSLNNAFVKGNK
jgi:ribosomal protein S11